MKMANASQETASRGSVGCAGAVLSGGGAKGAYELGVLKALLGGKAPSTGYEPLVPEVYTGTSVGSFNAAFMVSHGVSKTDQQAVVELERVWKEEVAAGPTTCGNGVFRIRGLPFQGLGPACLRHPVQNALALSRDATYFSRFFAAETAQFVRSDSSLGNRFLQALDLNALISVEPLTGLIARNIKTEDLVQSPKALKVVASNFKTGEPRVFSKADIVSLGLTTIRASASIPGIFSPVEIDGEPYVDGGVTMNTPFLPAIKSGARDIHVVFLDPCIWDIAFTELEGTFDTVYRLYVILIASRMNNGVDQVRTCYREIQRLRDAGVRGRELEFALKELEQLNEIAEYLIGSRVGEFPVLPVVHLYRPSRDLGGAEGLLDFRLSNILENLEHGYNDAVQHDCTTQGCILPDSERRAA